MNNHVNLLTKTTTPKVLQEILPRRNIAEIIDKTSLDEMIYFVAPYGCGKTMAVIHWLKKHNKDAAWINLDERENWPVFFWEHLTVTILRFAGEIKEAEKILPDFHLTANHQALFEKNLARISLRTGDKILVIDNFEFIQDSELLCKIKAIISNMLGDWRIILIGRGELPPIFNDFILKRRLRLITLKELSFSQEEIDEYFLMNGFSLAKKDLAQICTDTVGWPAAINAILTVPHNGTLKYSDIAKAYVMSYFEKEIWEQLDEKIKIFLLKTSILNKLTPSICHYVTGIEEYYLILRNLYFNGIFTLMLEERDTYCYHHVFREFLLDKLSSSGIDVNTIYIKVGWWFYDRNESISALHYFYKAKHIYGINMTFKKIRPADIGMEKYLEATRCLTSLDINDLRDYPEVAVRIALIHFISGDICQVKQIYEIILKWFESGFLPIPPEEYIDLFWEIGWLRYLNPDEHIIFNSKFHEWINIMEYGAHLIENDRSRASALRLPSALRSARDFSADIDGLEKLYKMNIESGYGFIFYKPFLYILDLAIAEIAYEREEFNKAEKIVRKILPEIKRLKLTDLYFSATYLLVKISRAIHNPKEINELTARAKELIINNAHYFILPNFHALELRNRLADGIAGVTEIFEKENTPYIDKFYYYLIYRHITFVRALLSEAKFSEANLILGSLELLCGQYKRNLDLIEVKILCSIAEYGLGYEEDAYHHLKTALDNGRKYGFIRIFSDDAVLLWPVLSLIRKNDEDTYIKKVIISCKKTLARAGNIAVPDKKAQEQLKLTKKEVEILKLLQAGMSYEEIALDKNIKVGTVRAHIHSIYSKLNVDNKISAVVLAQKSGIIEKMTLSLK